jgi:hypothetical protein
MNMLLVIVIFACNNKDQDNEKDNFPTTIELLMMFPIKAMVPPPLFS